MDPSARQPSRTILIIFAAILLAGGVLVIVNRDDSSLPDEPSVRPFQKPSSEPDFGKAADSAPPPPSMERMKTQGCVADGLLSGYGEKTDTLAKLINRSDCYYLHRAIETWLQPPDFEEVKAVEEKVTKKDIVYGMFIAEAIDTNANYRYPPEDRDFDFDAMCREGSKNKWGEHTCQPSLEKREYSLYVQYITKQAIDMGVQSFLFGQVYLQDATDRERSLLPIVIGNMRGYAASKGMEIVIGAQTNDIEDERYLRMFDYIEGGVGLHPDGRIEDGPCFSRWWKKPGDWCWALLWHDRFASKANNVFVHLDWSGKVGDDMSTFARMPAETRRKAMRDLHAYFTSRNVGFLLPFLAPLPKENDSCYGPKKRFYSPDNRYSCKDEDTLNAILRKAL
jgi:hypothetical protein